MAPNHSFESGRAKNGVPLNANVKHRDRVAMTRSLLTFGRVAHLMCFGFLGWHDRSVGSHLWTTPLAHYDGRVPFPGLGRGGDSCSLCRANRNAITAEAICIPSLSAAMSGGCGARPKLNDE